MLVITMSNRTSTNPFGFSGALNFTNEQILEMFVEDHNYSRFIKSKRNVFLWGERGSGKTMSLLFNKISIMQDAEKALEQNNPVEFLPVYISCITPLVDKREYLLTENDFKSAVISEHYFVLSIALSIVETLLPFQSVIDNSLQEEIEEELSFILGIELPNNGSILKKLHLFLRKKIRDTQVAINDYNSDAFYQDTYTFSSLIMAFIDQFQKIKYLSATHFIFMIDDAHDLNPYQQKSLNGWIAYRDNSSFSFKVSAAKVLGYEMKTSSGGGVLEGHDYSSINLEEPYQNSDSNYGKLAEKIVKKRLELIGVNVTPEQFFPESKGFKTGIELCNEEARQQAIIKYGNKLPKKITDHVYKYGRAIYFRKLASSKRNRPKYSGYETIAHLSTGVIRNLLEPCFYMYEEAASRSNGKSVLSISSTIQSSQIDSLSKKYWQKINDGVDKEIDCTREQAEKLKNLFNGLAKYFRERLLDENCSEPRAIKFTISAKSDAIIMSEIIIILNIARRMQLLYKRSGNSKDDGAIEEYYAPNRILWPARGLDPVGQHSYASIQAKYLLAAMQGESIPWRTSIEENTSIQEDVFDGQV